GPDEGRAAGGHRELAAHVVRYAVDARAVILVYHLEVTAHEDRDPIIAPGASEAEAALSVRFEDVPEEREDIGVRDAKARLPVAAHLGPLNIGTDRDRVDAVAVVVVDVGVEQGERAAADAEAEHRSPRPRLRDPAADARPVLLDHRT